MKKVFDQTVRDFKREVNKKVLKIPGIEQKILDATSNEPWGPHGTVLADIAQATRSYHEYQIIMTVIWRRINDTKKNWRHVYKGLTVLEYLVAHGSERVIDEIRDHAHQISILYDFQYIDSSGRDQGSNVRRKSQSLVALVNDAEKIRQVRKKANANKEKYYNMVSTSGMHHRSQYAGGGYNDDNNDGVHGNKDSEQSGYGRNMDSRGSDIYDRGYSDNQSTIRYGRDDEYCDTKSCRDDNYKGGRGNYDRDFGTRNGNTDEDTDQFNDEGHTQTSRGGGRAQVSPIGNRQPEYKDSRNNLGAPPSYEEATSHREHAQNEDAVGNSPPPETSSPRAPKGSSVEDDIQGQKLPEIGETLSHNVERSDIFDEFDPRGSAAVVAPAGTNLEMDIFGFSTLDPVCSSGLMSVNTDATCNPCIPNNLDLEATFAPVSSVSNVLNQVANDPFGDSPFKVMHGNNSFTPQQNLSSVTSCELQNSTMGELEAPRPVPQAMESTGYSFGDAFYATAPTAITMNDQVSTAEQFLAIELAMPNSTAAGGMAQHMEATATTSSNVFQHGISTTNEQSQANIASQPSSVTSLTHAVDLPPAGLSTSIAPQACPYPLSQLGSEVVPPASQIFSGKHPSHPGQFSTSVPITDPSNPFADLEPSESSAWPLAPSSMYSQPNLPASLVSQPASSTILSQPGLSASGPQSNLSAMVSVPPKTIQDDKFETKSTVWADTLSRGLVNLNISGPKINPLSDIGIDFDSINRKEKRKEEKNAAPQVSTINMGKAMGAGSGLGRAGASGLAPPPNPMMSMAALGTSTGGGGLGTGMGMSAGGYGGGIHQPMGMGMGMNMGMGMGIHMGMGPAASLQPLAGAGFPPRQPMPGFGYNPTMGMGGSGAYDAPQQYGAYR